MKKSQIIDQAIVGGLSLKRHATEGVLEMGTDMPGVMVQLGLEGLTRVYNDSGDEIPNGAAVSFAGNYLGAVPTIGLADASSARTALRFFGLATAAIADGAYGFVVQRGMARGVDTSGLSLVGVLYLSITPGEVTMIEPVYPAEVVGIGGVLKVHASEGIIFVNPSLALQRQAVVKSDNFTSNGIGAGTFYKFGNYTYSEADANLDQATPSQTFGTEDVAYAAHPFMVAGGPGTVDAGVIGLQISGTSISDDGTETPGDSDLIVPDITAALLNDYAEGKKYMGTVTYTLIVVSGTPTAYSFDFNYGYAKYEDFGNNDFYVTNLECLWRGGAADAASFNIELLKHSADGWDYHATAFVAGNGVLAERAVDQADFLRVSLGVDSNWKRTNLTEYIEGSGSEGLLIRITTGANNTIQTMDMHLGVSVKKIPSN